MEAHHMHEFLETVLPGFSWILAGDLAVGLIESFLWGAYGALVFVPIHNFLHRRWVGSHTRGATRNAS